MSTVRAALSLALLSLCGCLSYPVATTDATRPLTAGRFTEIGPAEGTSTGFSLLQVFSFGPSDAIGSARDAALHSVGGDALVDVRARIDHLYFLFLFAIHKTTVSGTAVVEDGTP